MQDTSKPGLDTGSAQPESAAVAAAKRPTRAGLSPSAWFRIVAIAEAVSWTGLLIGMLFKYVISDNEIGVTIFGPIHGGIFIIYVLVTLLVIRPLRWTAGTTTWALLASVPPLTTLVFERWAMRTGRLR